MAREAAVVGAKQRSALVVTRGRWSMFVVVRWWRKRAGTLFVVARWWRAEVFMAMLRSADVVVRGRSTAVVAWLAAVVVRRAAVVVARWWPAVVAR